MAPATYKSHFDMTIAYLQYATLQVSLPVLECDLLRIICVVSLGASRLNMFY